MSLTMLETLRKENGGEPIRAVLYARYSSDMQREESIEAQVEAIKAFAAKENIVITEQYIDKALTGTTDNRPEFQRMIADSKLHEFQLLLVHKTDRFFRDTYNSFVYRHMLLNNGVHYLAVAQPLDENKPEEKLLDTLLTAMASYYSDNLKGEVLKGLRINAESARHTGGVPPLGYDLSPDKHLVINEKEAEAVRIIFNMTISGKSYSEILYKLRINGYVTKKGKDFGKNSLNAILHNPKYTGDFIYNRTYGKDPITHKRNSHRERPKEEQIIIPDAIPAIISREDFAKVQKILLDRRNYSRANKTRYLLTGKIFCGVCNCSYTGNVKLPNKQHLLRIPTCTYRCNNRSRKTGSNACDNKEINRDHLESYILDIIEESVFNPETVSNIIDKFQEYITQKNAAANSVLTNLEMNIKAFDKQMEALADKFIVTDNPALLKRIDDRIREIDNKKKEAVLEYEKEKASIGIKVPSKPKMLLYIKKAKEQFKTKTLDELQDIINLYVDRVIVHKDSIDIILNLVPKEFQQEFTKTHIHITRSELRAKYENNA